MSDWPVGLSTGCFYQQSIFDCLETISRGGFNIMQSIFRPAARRETLGEQSEGGRRDGGLKMGWTKPLPSAWPMGIDCLPDLGRGSDVARSDECVGCFVGPRCLQ
jgi:hypothetical protein